MTNASLRFPFRVTSRGGPANSSGSTLIEEQLYQLLLTIPGERVNRPEFGCGIQRLVFAGAGPAAAAAAEYTITAAIRRYLSRLISIDGVRVTTDDATLNIVIAYTELATGQATVSTLTRPLEASP